MECRSMNKMIIATAAAATLSLAALPAAAQSDQAQRPITGYGTLGYSHVDGGSTNLGGVTGRLGLRFGRFVGAEAEGTFGVDDDKGRVSGVPVQTELKRSVGVYGVGYVPVSPKIDLFGRVGLGNSKVETSGLGQAVRDSRDSVNYGGGAQVFLTDHDGVRAEYTRESFRHGPGHDNVWGLSYVRKF
jgi:hypothetical protein